MARPPLPCHPDADLLQDPALTDHLFLHIASQPIGDSTPEDWVAEQTAGGLERCTATEPIAVDGATGLIGSDGCDIVAVTTAGRGYWISLRTSNDDPAAVAPYDRAWFEEVLATVQLHPEDAVDVAPSRDALTDRPSTISNALSLQSAHDPDRCAGGLDGRPLSRPDRD